jgi:hypothetical protein
MVKKKLKPEQYVVISIYVVLFLVVGYLVLANLFPKNVINTTGVYSLSAKDIGITSELRSLYVDNDVFGGEIDGKRLVIAEEPFNFVFNPKKVVADNTSAELQISFEKPNTEVYLDGELIIPDLDYYDLVYTTSIPREQGILYKGQEFSNTSVWVSKHLTLDSYESANNSEDFIYRNFPTQSIYSFAELGGGAPLIQDYEQEETRIKTQFRDNLKLAVYADDYLEISFEKQDLNNYIGADEYYVKITDYQGNLILEETYEDDGEKKDTKVEGEEQKFKIKLYNLDRNIYYINFVKDKINPSSDSSIKDIRINSNKVLILDKCLPLDEFEFYTKVDSARTIGFKYWWTSKAQEIKVRGTLSKTINLDEDWKGKTYEEELGKGYYDFEITTGVVWVYSDLISPSEENWFYLPQKVDSKLIESDIIIIDNNKLEINEDHVLYKKHIKVNEDSRFKVQVLDKTQIYFKDFKLILGN